MKIFQVVLLFIFGSFAILAVLIFAGIIPIGQDDAVVASETPLTLWGTFSPTEFNEILVGGQVAGEQYAISYVQKDEKRFEEILVNALASGTGPDMVIMPHDSMVAQEGKLFPIPYLSINERQFRDTFIEGSEIYLRANDMIGLPMYVDPLVMYWNRDIFSREGLVSPPKTWTELQIVVEQLTKKDNAGNILQAGVALGGTSNVNNFKEIISAQVLQTGNKITTRTRTAGQGVLTDGYTTVLGGAGAADTALRYYTEFANPALAKYSWNSAKRNSIEEFTSGKLAIYFGLASEVEDIKTRNTHLNFDVATIPQIEGAPIKATFGRFYGLFIVKNSPNINVSIQVAAKLSFGVMAKVYSDVLNVAPARRDLLSAGSTDVFGNVFYRAAVNARAWLDPDRNRTIQLFADMVESVLVGRAGPEESVTNTDELLKGLF